MINRHLDALSEHESLIIRFLGTLLVAAGMFHVLSLPSGPLPQEMAPGFLGAYFESLMLFDIIGGIGLLLIRPWGVWIALCIFATQIPAHIFMLAIDTLSGYHSGFPVWARIIDMTLLTAGAAYLRPFFTTRESYAE